MSSDDEYRSATLLFEQAKYLLDDEIQYAHSLREGRRTAAGLVLIVIGIGLFRINLYDDSASLAVPHWAAMAIRLIMIAAYAALLVGVYLIHTERRVLRELLPRASQRGGALSVLHLTDRVLDDFRIRPPIEVLSMATDGLRLSYRRLRDANRRVRRRIVSGTCSVFVGLFLVFCAFAIYTLTWGVGGP